MKQKTPRYAWLKADDLRRQDRSDNARLAVECDKAMADFDAGIIDGFKLIRRMCGTEGEGGS